MKAKNVENVECGFCEADISGVVVETLDVVVCETCVSSMREEINAWKIEKLGY